MNLKNRLLRFIRKEIYSLRIKDIIRRNKGLVFYDKSVMIDKTTHIDIRNGAKCILGKNVTLRSDEKGYHTAMSFPTRIFADTSHAKIEIGDNCRLNGVSVHAKLDIRIGANCVIATGVHIIDSDGHVVNSANRTNWDQDIPKSIFIGDNVWIGLNAIILKGTTIGDNSIVSAGSVVKGFFPANVIIQGNPAIIVKELNLNKTVDV